MHLNYAKNVEQFKCIRWANLFSIFTPTLAIFPAFM